MTAALNLSQPDGDGSAADPLRPVGSAAEPRDVDSPLIRIAGPADAPALAALRRAWTAEQHGPVNDEGFEARFLAWYERGSDHRVSWLAAAGGDTVGMMNLAVFERMPQPGRDAGTWGYLANAFVLAAYRN